MNTTDDQKKEIETLAQAVLDARKQYPDQSLAWLYNQATMPEALKKVHLKLDKRVDKLYGLTKAKVTTSDRIKGLFSMYQELTKKLV